MILLPFSLDLLSISSSIRLSQFLYSSPFFSNLLSFNSFHHLHHVATHDPGHGTKFVTLPSSMFNKSLLLFNLKVL